MRESLWRMVAGCFLFIPLVLFGAKTKPRQFTILGDQTITREVAPNGAAAVENEFIKIEVTGLIAQFVNGGGSNLKRTFGFSLKQSLELRRVVVEDVTGATAETLVTDAAPVVEKNYWKGHAAVQLIGRETTAWLYAPGDDWRVFRFTIDTNRGEMVFLQPSVIGTATKLLYMEAALQAALNPSQARLQALLDAAGKLLPKEAPALFLTILQPPPAGDFGLFNALKQARKQKATMVVASERADWAVSVVRAALGKAKKGQFQNQVMVIVAPAADAAAFTGLGAASGIELKVGSTGE